MAQLITLKLQPFSRLARNPPLPPSNLPPPIPAKSPRRTKSEMSSASPLPRTQQEWRIVLDEVRNTYLRRQYRQCSARCLQLLQGAPDMVRRYQVTLLSIAENSRMGEQCFQNYFRRKSVLDVRLSIVVI